MRVTTDLYKDSFKLMVVYVMKKQGHTFKNCEQCGRSLNEKTYRIHHTKYEGATVKDLQVVCQKCNAQPENRFLK